MTTIKLSTLRVRETTILPQKRKYAIKIIINETNVE